MSAQPRPGSILAQALGCTCDVAANRCGHGIAPLHVGAPLRFEIARDCPLHDIFGLAAVGDGMRRADPELDLPWSAHTDKAIERAIGPKP